MVAILLHLAVALLGIVEYSNAAGQCSIVADAHCGHTKHAINHKLPTSVGSTYYADGFHGGTMYAKFESEKQSISGYVIRLHSTKISLYQDFFWSLLIFSLS